MPEPLLGRVIWYELLTNDVKAAADFYSHVVGWKAEPFDPSEPEGYTIFKRQGGAGVAGVMKIPQGMNFPPHWGMYVGGGRPREDGGRDRAARRLEPLTSDRRAERGPDADDEGPTGCGALDHGARLRRAVA